MKKNIGKVILAGAGPGDPDLITVKAADCLRRADVVLTDRLVSAEIIRRYVPAGAELVEVGKQCRRGISTPQETIDALLVKYAMQGKYVVRLKGGDVSFFSNILNELNVLAANKIPYEIVPGVTAASGAAAYAGMPLTARGYATAVRFLTYYQSSLIGDAQWKDLAQTNDTLVFYMSSETLNGLADKLIEHGIGRDKQLAVIEQATTPYQRVYTAPVHEYASKLQGIEFLSPSLIVVGDVVGLHASLQWQEESEERKYYFQPLTAAVEPIATATKNKRYADRA
ncbi:uroporphyrinogen-III C-methyltransferase [Sediminibacterium soli]|uniref:uroporphyrinogen-III C-methyltransferase n=1 Tax=Sediminibacterium soli TaxID=2698829 RepID=UPI00137A4093|nr:uroporphyrinogen-III C-methyltransferase [Sediminibacterium soli]NCI46819.1 uroporphyrinogen-III C-methyltransferase [Sediminibacterium soli]